MRIASNIYRYLIMKTTYCYAMFANNILMKYFNELLNSIVMAMNTEILMISKEVSRGIDWYVFWNISYNT